ncbi:methyltransferase [Christensenellaceae bacterium OttesenSCG-928-K19]|nr:methyltransferase [Christensenellaceae bacterium OttesenSCG-928-K19]
MRGIKAIEAVYQDDKPANSGFWLGNPSEKAKQIYCGHFGIVEEELTEREKQNLKFSVLTSEKIGTADIELAKALKSDLMWFSPELDPATWVHPEGKPMWDCFKGEARKSLGDNGVFSDTEDVAEVEAFDWPNPDYLDFGPTLKNIENAHENGLAVLGGMWCPFFHIACDFFGMENYFIKMHTDPNVVIAVTEHITNFYLEANKRCFDVMGDKLTAAFFGNDLGSQLSMMISDECFEKFIVPYMKPLIAQMKSYGLKVTLHSCGSIHSIIPRLIDLGVDAIHPLQAKAVNMDAETLARDFKGEVIFVGGVDTQDLLPFGTPQQVRDEVYRLRDLFGEKFIVSPSHEALLENVSIENVIAMSEAATE